MEYGYPDQEQDAGRFSAIDDIYTGNVGGLDTAYLRLHHLHYPDYLFDCPNHIGTLFRRRKYPARLQGFLWYMDSPVYQRKPVFGDCLPRHAHSEPVSTICDGSRDYPVSATP